MRQFWQPSFSCRRAQRHRMRGRSPRLPRPTLAIADRRPNFVEPDFTLVNLPTTLRLPRYKSVFRISHRFARTLNDPDFGKLASDLFDNGALIGLEYRFGVMRGLQAGIYRTSGENHPVLRAVRPDAAERVGAVHVERGREHRRPQQTSIAAMSSKKFY